ncbi:hypothetical protein [Chitinophaga agri]|uniref:Uncharacterized protein n=1 Tax=Chitinophaga agri TaxID=2703787 RepID=A0A6B9Z8X8_9BACT|nr:hypothetical protein [Chitinophaga agri]QHS58477.1 hypothetical protein GWR21_02365 [Chitinophaga agri]
MKSEKRLTLEDFQMEAVNSGNEVEKMLGLAAAGCHVTGPHKNDDGSVTLIDYEWGLAEAAPELSLERDFVAFP